VSALSYNKFIIYLFIYKHHAYSALEDCAKRTYDKLNSNSLYRPHCGDGVGPRPNGSSAIVGQFWEFGKQSLKLRAANLR